MITVTNGDLGVRAYIEKGVLHFWDSSRMCEHEMKYALDNLGIVYQEVETAHIMKYKIELPPTAKVKKIDKDNVEIWLPGGPSTTMTAYTATSKLSSDISECELEDFIEFMMEKTAQDEALMEWNQDAHTIRIATSCLHTICKYLKRRPRSEAIGNHTYGDMAAIFENWLDTSEKDGGRFVFIHCKEDDDC